MPPRWRTAANLLLRSPFPIFPAWGPDLRLRYNDTYAPILGDHASIMGKVVTVLRRL